jgi:hypothetical protein
MAYHESFWVAIAAATPVIALTNTVAASDVTSLWLSAKATERSITSQFFFYAAVLLSGFNLLIQAILLFQALESLATGKDHKALFWAALVVAIGMAYVLVILASDIGLRYALRRDEARQNARTDITEIGVEENNKTGPRRAPIRPGLRRLVYALIAIVSSEVLRYSLRRHARQRDR